MDTREVERCSPADLMGKQPMHGILHLLFMLSLSLLFAWEASAAERTSDGAAPELPAGVFPVDFAAGTVTVLSRGGASHHLQVEIAETVEQQERGLMYRTAMPAQSGMLFVYPREERGGFWMLNTRIPLSIAFAGDDGVIFQIDDMAPCTSRYAFLCPGYPARAPFRYALEVNQGYFGERGIGVGDRIEYVRTEPFQPVGEDRRRPEESR